MQRANKPDNEISLVNPVTDLPPQRMVTVTSNGRRESLGFNSNYCPLRGKLEDTAKHVVVEEIFDKCRGFGVRRLLNGHKGQ